MASPLIFAGDFAKSLKSKLNINDNAFIITGESDDPTAVAKDAPIGSLYIKSDDGVIYRKLDAGSTTTWEIVGAGSGGTKNYVSDKDGRFESGIGGWATYKEAGADYVDGTGGASTLALAVTASALEGKQSLEITKPASDVSGEGVSISDLTLDEADKGKALTINISADLSNAVALGDWEVRAYDQTNAAILYVGPVDARAISNSKGLISLPLYTESNSDVIRLSLHCLATETSTYTMRIDEVKVGPSAVSITGPTQTEWEEYTPVLTGFGTPTGVNTWFKRVGDSIQIRGKFSSGTSTAVSAEIGLPFGYTIDVAKVTSLQIIGNIVKGAATANVWSAVASGGDDFIQAVEENTGNFAANANGIVSSGQVLYFTTELIPITGLSDSSNIINENQLAIQSVAAKGYMLAASLATVNNVEVRVPLDGSEFDIGGILDTVNDKITVPRTGRYFVTGACLWQTSGAGRLFSLVKVNGVLIIRAADSGNGGQVSSLVSGVLDLQAGDEVELFALQDSGGALNLLSNGGLDTFLTISAFPDLSLYGVVKNKEKSQVDVLTAPGYGSTGNRVLRFSTVQENLGSAIIYTSDAVNGDTFTINESGQYSVMFQFESTDPDREYAITKNQTILTSNPDSLPNDEFMLGGTATASRRNSMSLVYDFVAGDVIRAAADGGAIAGTAGDCRFKIIKLI